MLFIWLKWVLTVAHCQSDEAFAIYIVYAGLNTPVVQKKAVEKWFIECTCILSRPYLLKKKKESFKQSSIFYLKHPELVDDYFIVRTDIVLIKLA